MHPSLSRLGPDVLVEPFDRAEARRRAARRASDLAVGELLLDQQVVSGIGNIYRCEALFLRRINPFTTRSDLTDDALDALVSTAVTLMRANLQPGQGFAREFGKGPERTWVYRRTGRPCHRCRQPIRSARLGEGARRVYWCESCQPPTASVTFA